MIRAIGVLFALFGSISAQAAVWTDVNEWSPAWEQKFNQWVSQSWQTDVFSRKSLPNGQSNPYQGLRSDCADTVYSMRIIFAYENKLPFVIKDPTSSNNTISNRMSRFDKDHESIRIKKFLNYIFNIASTRSLPSDTYPVAVNKSQVRSGALILTTVKNHHSWTIKNIQSIGVPHLVFNSVVGSNSGSGLQERISWPNPEWVFEGNFTPAGNAGFRYWRNADELLIPVWQVKGYSEEQYKIPLKQWNRTVQKRLAVTDETDEQLIARLTKTACEGFATRVTAVNDGIDYISRNKSCMPYATYDTYSTPNRDLRVFDDILVLRRSYKDILAANGGNALSAKTQTQLNKLFPRINSNLREETRSMPRSGLDAASICVVEYAKGRSIDMAEFKRRLFLGLISNNPHDGVEYRWGELAGPSPKAKSCQSWDQWTPDLNQD